MKKGIPEIIHELAPKGPRGMHGHVSELTLGFSFFDYFAS